jgi:predicted NAD/FAD-binding protein
MTLINHFFHPSQKPSIAIIGGGISGLTVAYLLRDHYQILVLEKQNRIGGHANTIQIPNFIDYPTNNNIASDLSVDTGFIVYNNRNYPLFSALLEKLNVNTQNSEMSFSIKHPLLDLEYNGHNFNSLFAQRKNIFKPKFWKFLKEIVRFNHLALQEAEKPIDSAVTLQSFLTQHRFQGDLLNWYLLPMIAAIWSSSLQTARDFPLVFFIQFFKNHGLLELKNRPQWRTISGGSIHYLRALTSSFHDKIITNIQLKGVHRHNHKVLLHFHDQPSVIVDHIVFACHSDEALSLLQDASIDEKNILSALPYSENQAIVHQDTSIMPNNKRAWASWNYLLSGQPDAPPIVTYDINRLQSLPTKQPILITLNGQAHIKSNKILRSFTYHHPQFQINTLSAQQQWQKISGVNQTHFCGAYWFNGFHEDGVRSAQRVSNALGGESLAHHVIGEKS